MTAVQVKLYENYCKTCSTRINGCLSCCQEPFVNEEIPGFWLTLQDVANIVNTRKIPPESFCRYTFVPEGEDDDDDADEVYGELMYHGDNTILISPQDFDERQKGCTFLDPVKGCTIFKDRPKMCRIYPFWFKEEKGEVVITIEHSGKKKEDDCLITKTHYRNKNIPFMLSTMDETEENMRALIVEYIGEMKKHAELKKQLEDKEIIDVLVDNGFVTKQTKDEIYAKYDKNKPAKEQLAQ